MKKLFKVSLLVTLTAIMAVGCGKTTTSNKKTTTSGSSSNSSTNNGSNNGSTDSDPTTVEGCNGVYRAAATRCYFSEIIPDLQVSGTGTAAAPQSAVNNVQIWSSRNLSSSVSQNVFRTDATFKVRFKPTTASSGSSLQGRNCTPFPVSYTRAKVYFMLRRSSDSITTIYSTTATLNNYSARLSLPVSGGTSDPYILEIMGVETDHRCNETAYGKLSSDLKAACTAGTYWTSIPLVTTTSAPTNCIGLKVEFSTDTTYDLP